MDKENNNNVLKEQSHLKLSRLSPLDKKNDVKVSLYLNHINDAIEDKEVYNIALTGVYGSGKSTILKSYISKFPNKTFLPISLASFKEVNDYQGFKDEIQLTILQQILYSQSAEKLPESRINRISEINPWNRKYISKVLIVLTFIVFSYFTLKFYLTQINPNNWSFSKSFSYGAFLSTMFFISSLFFIIQFFIKTLINSKINKINIKGEAEISSKGDSTDFLNKYMDEILYFFEKTQTDVVIIEDIDRFNSIEIYRTFREINYILNNYLRNTKKEYKKVTFLYAIKDSLFENELDRTKFFDLIIPTIPFVNYSNSKNVLTTKLQEIYLDNADDFNLAQSEKEFINTVSTFILDNRVLKNIINEFIIFREQQRTEDEQFNQEKLLAIVIYKNLRPKDFSMLHKGDSNINIAFNSKDILISDSIEKLNLDISELQNQKNTVLAENLKFIKELNTIYLYHIKGKVNSANYEGLSIDGKSHSYSEIIEN